MLFWTFQLKNSSLKKINPFLRIDSDVGNLEFNKNTGYYGSVYDHCDNLTKINDISVKITEAI